MDTQQKTLKHRGKTITLSAWRSKIKNISQVENAMIDARLIGSAFSELEKADLRVAADQVIVRTAAIVGCSLPITDFFSEIVSNELSVFIKTMGYGDLTLEEICLAIRLNSQASLKFPSGVEFEQIKFTGSVFNVDFVARVLSSYMQLRNLLDRKFQNLIDGHE